MIKVVATWLLYLMLAVAVFILAVALANARIYSPQQQVSNYFAALHDGDGSRALGILNATVPDANPAMLDGAPLQAAVADLADLTVGPPVPLGGDRVSITAAYTMNGSPHETGFVLRKTGTDWMFFDRWEMEPSVLPVIDLSIINQFDATLNGMRVGVSEGQENFAVFLPGEYESHYTSEYFAAPAVQEVLASPEDAKDAKMRLITAPTGKLVEDVQQQINGFLDSCTQQKVLQPAGCPLSHRTNNRVAAESIKWSITEYPKVDISAFNGAWVMKPLEFTGKIEFEQTDLLTGRVSTVARTDRYGFAARLNVGADSITVTPVVSF